MMRTDNSETPVFDAHRERLARAFATHVIELQPSSLLDVGCGAGLLLSELQDHGRPARGIETNERRVAAARERGLDVHLGDASALPFASATFDWVVIRHVLHHLDDPGVAVREAWRVARLGVILAEPFCDPSLPAQVAMTHLDAFTSELLARAGHIHHPYLSPGRLIALVPDEPVQVWTRSYGELTPVPEAEARSLALRAAAGNELTAGDSERLQESARAASAGKLSYLGSAAAFVRRA